MKNRYDKSRRPKIRKQYQNEYEVIDAITKQGEKVIRWEYPVGEYLLIQIENYKNSNPLFFKDDLNKICKMESKQ